MTRARQLFLAWGTLFLLGLGLAAWSLQPPAVAERDLSGLSGDVARGAYVARLSGCIACHTDSRAGGAVLAGGAAIETAFGSFYGPNITPHPKAGIGAWRLADFARALTAGLSPSGQHYFPSFPYAFYRDLSDQDIVDLWAAVRSVPPVATPSRAHDLAFPFNLRSALPYWKTLFLALATREAPADKSEAWQRGRYLASAAGHCGACHTPRNLLGGRIQSRRFAGATGPAGEKIPAITPAALRDGGWSEDDLAFALRSGLMPDGDVFGGGMAEVVRDGTRFWSDQDLKAIATYLFTADDLALVETAQRSTASIAPPVTDRSWWASETGAGARPTAGTAAQRPNS